MLSVASSISTLPLVGTCIYTTACLLFGLGRYAQTVVSVVNKLLNTSARMRAHLEATEIRLYNVVKRAFVFCNQACLCVYHTCSTIKLGQGNEVETGKCRRNTTRQSNILSPGNCKPGGVIIIC